MSIDTLFTKLMQMKLISIDLTSESFTSILISASPRAFHEKQKIIAKVFDKLSCSQFAQHLDIRKQERAQELRQNLSDPIKRINEREFSERFSGLMKVQLIELGLKDEFTTTPIIVGSMKVLAQVLHFLLKLISQNQSLALQKEKNKKAVLSTALLSTAPVYPRKSLGRKGSPSLMRSMRNLSISSSLSGNNMVDVREETDHSRAEAKYQELQCLYEVMLKSFKDQPMALVQSRNCQLQKRVFILESKRSENEELSFMYFTCKFVVFSDRMHDELMSVKEILLGLNDKNLKGCIGMIDQLSQSAIRRLKGLREGGQDDVMYHIKSDFLKPGFECMVKDTVSYTVEHIDLKRVGSLQAQLYL